MPAELPTESDYRRAVEVVSATGEASTATLQRALGVDYAAAVSLMDRMQRAGIIGPPNGASARPLPRPSAGGPAAATVAEQTAPHVPAALGPPPLLRQEYAAALAKFGIPTALLDAAGVRSLTDAECRNELGIGGHADADLSGILFPYREPRSGQRIGARVRLDRPLAGGAKYLSEQGCRYLFLPPVDAAWLDDSAVPVVLVEAEKSALALAALAVRCGRQLVPIACGGCWGWRRTVGKREMANGGSESETGPSPSLDWIADWQGRTAIIAFDANTAINANVEAARRGLARELSSRGARVLIANVPAESGVNGPDDLIALSGDAAALKMLDAARPFAEAALAEAEAAIAGLEKNKSLDADLAIQAIAAVEDASRRRLLSGKLAALKISGVSEDFINPRIAELRERWRQEAEASRSAARQGRLLGMPVNGSELLDRLGQLPRRYVVLSAAQAAAAALWVLHTWAIAAADCTGYLNICSPVKRCGKSRLLDVLELLAARPLRTDGISPAALLRSVELDSPALLLDEADATFRSDREKAEAIRGLLNSGYRRGGSFRLCVKQDENQVPHDFPTFCPKAIAGIGKLPDTVADRAIPICLRRKLRSESVAAFRRREAEKEAAPLAEAAEAWTLQRLEVLRAARPAMPEALNDRQQDIAEPLVAIAEAAGGEWPERARRALLELCGDEAGECDSLGPLLLADIRAAFAASGADRLASRELCERLVADESSPWADWHAGKAMSPSQLARQLAKFGIAPRTVRTAEGTPKGYMRADFEDSWRRYVPAEDGSGAVFPESKRHTATTRINTGESGDFAAATANPCGGPENAVSPNKDAACGGVAFPEGGNRQTRVQPGLFDSPPDPPTAKPNGMVRVDV